MNNPFELGLHLMEEYKEDDDARKAVANLLYRWLGAAEKFIIDHLAKGRVSFGTNPTVPMKRAIAFCIKAGLITDETTDEKKYGSRYALTSLGKELAEHVSYAYEDEIKAFLEPEKAPQMLVMFSEKGPTPPQGNITDEAVTVPVVEPTVESVTEPRDDDTATEDRSEQILSRRRRR